jgi:hypothetical protein
VQPKDQPKDRRLIVRMTSGNVIALTDVEGDELRRAIDGGESSVHFTIPLSRETERNGTRAVVMDGEVRRVTIFLAHVESVEQASR